MNLLYNTQKDITSKIETFLNENVTVQSRN